MAESRLQHESIIKKFEHSILSGVRDLEGTRSWPDRRTDGQTDGIARL
jgi:hypothetical protein